jgi:5-methylcytosine-specific restriction endonuclease McrA
MSRYSLTHLPDPVLLRDLSELVARERVTTAEVLAHLAEVDARRLYLPAAYPSMYAWCVGELRLSEDSAFKRIQAARLARRFPVIFPMLADGRLHLSAVNLLAPHLLSDNADELLAAATNQGKAAIERLLAERFPRPDLPTLVLTCIDAEHAPAHVTTPAGEHAPAHVGARGEELAPGPVEDAGAHLRARIVQGNVTQLAPGQVVHESSRAKVTPLSPGRVALQVTLAQDTHDKLRYAQSLLGHAVPSGDLAQVLDRALDSLIAQLEKRRFSRSARTRPNRRGHSENVRHVPAAVRSMVWRRDGGQCTFVSDSGHRCEARTRLELDHIDPVAHGGQSTPSRLRLRCRAHNQFEAECTYGTDFMRHKREQAWRRAERSRALAHERAAASAHETTRTRDVAGARAATLTHAATSACERPTSRDQRDSDVIPWLRQLGFRADEACRGAAACEHMTDAPLEVRVRVALASLAPHSARKVASSAGG